MRTHVSVALPEQRDTILSFNQFKDRMDMVDRIAMREAEENLDEAEVVSRKIVAVGTMLKVKYIMSGVQRVRQRSARNIRGFMNTYNDSSRYDQWTNYGTGSTYITGGTSNDVRITTGSGSLTLTTGSSEWTINSYDGY